MLIAPTDLTKGWSDPDASARAVAAWESEVGVRLPAAYRDFLIRFDGGYLWPNLFDSAIIRAGIVPSSGTDMVFERAYNIETSHHYWRGEIYGDGTPPGMVFVGDNPGGTEILLSVRPQDFGVIYLWSHSTNAWGSEGNDDSALIRQADSFPDFLGALYDTSGKSGYEAWYIPAYSEPGIVRNFEVEELGQ